MFKPILIIMTSIAIFSPLLRGQILTVKTGTIIAIQKEKDRFIVVADSRFSSAMDGTKQGDDSCKVIALDEKTFFFSTGKSQMLLNNKVVFDVTDIAKKVFNDFSSETNTEERIRKFSFYFGLFIRALLYDVAVQKPGSIGSNISKPNLMEAIIGSTTHSGELISYLIGVDAEPVLNSAVPLITFRIEKFDTQGVTVLGSDDSVGVAEFWQNTTERAKAANVRMRGEISQIINPDMEVIRLKNAVQAAIDWATNKNLIGGPLDILELKRGGIINWIQRKPGCK